MTWATELCGDVCLAPSHRDARAGVLACPSCFVAARVKLSEMSVAVSANKRGRGWRSDWRR